MTERQGIVNALTSWHNSLHDLRSERLSSVGVDDMGDLRDESESFSLYEDRFWELLHDIAVGKFVEDK